MKLVEINIYSIKEHPSSRVGINPQFEQLIGLLTPKTVELLLLLHPIVVRQVRKRSKRQKSYKLIAGLNSYLAVRSIGSITVPVLLVEETEVDAEVLFVSDHLLTDVFCRQTSMEMVKRWEELLKQSPETVAQLAEGVTRKSVQAALMGISMSSVRSIRRNLHLPKGQMEFDFHERIQQLEKAPQRRKNTLKSEAFDRLVARIQAGGTSNGVEQDDLNRLQLIVQEILDPSGNEVKKSHE